MEAFRLGRTTGTPSPCWSAQNFGLQGLKESLWAKIFNFQTWDNDLLLRLSQAHCSTSPRNCVNERNSPPLCFSFFSNTGLTSVNLSATENCCTDQKKKMHVFFFNTGNMLEILHFEKLEMPLSQLPNSSQNR